MLPTVDWASRWTKQSTLPTYPHPRGGEFTSWVETRSVDLVDDNVGDSYCMTHEGNTKLPDGSHLRVSETLRFRTLDELSAGFQAAGFEVTEIWGDWDRSPFESDSKEIIVLARSEPGQA